MMNISKQWDTRSTAWAKCYREAELASSGTGIVLGLAEGSKSDPRLLSGLALGSGHRSLPNLNCRQFPKVSSQLPKTRLLTMLSPGGQSPRGS